MLTSRPMRSRALAFSLLLATVAAHDAPPVRAQATATIPARPDTLGRLSPARMLADSARKSSRKVEKLYRKALAELFQGEDFLNMLKRREMYQHLDRAAERMAHCANTLHDIVVKIS